MQDSRTLGEGAEGPDSEASKRRPEAQTLVSGGLDSWDPREEGDGGPGRVSIRWACSRGAQPFCLAILLLVLLGCHVCVVKGRTAITSPGSCGPRRPLGIRAPPSRAYVAPFCR